jgi:hypothetical protein
MTFFNKPPQQGEEVKTDKADKIKQIKDFFPESKAVFDNAFTAIMQFKQIVEANRHSEEASAQLFNKNIDKKCQGNISVVSVTLEDEEQYLENEDEELIDGLIEGLHKELQSLHQDLTLLNKADKDEDRKKQYQAAIDFVDKIDAVCEAIQPARHTPGM